MKLDFKEIQQMDSEEIYKVLLPTINSIYQSFEYIGISQQSYHELVLKEIENSKKINNSSTTYSRFIKKRIMASLSERVRELINNESTSFNIINEYINQKFDITSNYKDAIENFKKLDTFFKKYNFISNPDLFIELINNNNIFTNMIKIVYNQYKSQIISGKYDKISKSKSLISSIEIYCMINDIEIKEEDTEEIYYTDGVESTDPVKAYLRDIAKIPLLSVEKERELALKIEQGDSNARSLFVESNLRLVVSVAKRYCNRGVPFLDLIQEGNIGLMKAIDKYDVKREIKFSTYAVWWIRQAIERAITDKSRNIRLPVHLYEKIGAYKKTVAKLEDKLNRQPTTNEIAKDMGCSA